MIAPLFLLTDNISASTQSCDSSFTEGCYIPPDMKRLFQKAEVANQVASERLTYIQTLIDKGNGKLADLPAFGGTSIESVSAPDTVDTKFLMFTKGINCPNDTPYNNSQLPAKSLLRVDVDGDCKADFLLQAVRVESERISGKSPEYSGVLIRVYSSLAESSVGSLEKSFPANPGVLPDERKHPLAYIYSHLDLRSLP
jgi:hypothetical protein